MLNSIALHNFQSHKNTLVSLDPGINCIVGTSDSGKTSILRGFRWVYENRPTGTAFISHWCKKDDTIVTVECAGGIVARVRSDGRNGYDVGGVELGAIGMDVPAQVTQLLNMSSINISSQHDAPFLLAETAGDVAKYLNKLIHLDLIDVVLSNAESERRGIKKDIAGAETEIADAKKELDSLSWVDKAAELLEELKKKEQLQLTKREEQGDLTARIATIRNSANLVAEGSAVVTKFQSIDLLTPLGKKKELDVKISSFARLIGSIEAANLVVGRGALVSKVGGLFEKIDTFLTEKKVAEKAYKELSSWVTKIEEIEGELGNKRSKLIKLEEEMPAVCPLCGKLLDKEMQ